MPNLSFAVDPFGHPLFLFVKPRPYYLALSSSMTSSGDTPKNFDSRISATAFGRQRPLSH